MIEAGQTENTTKLETRIEQLEILVRRLRKELMQAREGAHRQERSWVHRYAILEKKYNTLLINISK